MPKLLRVKMGAAAIYIIIGILGLTACVSIAISGTDRADSDAGIEQSLEVDREINENDEKTD